VTAVCVPGPQDELEQLRTQLQLATLAAQQAYRDSSRLIRLLAVIGDPASPDVLVDRTLGALSEVFFADVTCLVYTDGTQAEIIAARGFGEDELPTLPALPGADGLLTHNRLAAWLCPVEEAPRAAGLPIRSAAHIPLIDGPATGEGIILLRSAPTPFEPGELQMLQSVASRLRASVEEGERRDAIERLARTGHRLARHLELDPLLGEALDLLLDMSGAQSAAAVLVEDGVASMRAQVGLRSGLPEAWPMPASKLRSWPSALRGEPFVRSDLREAPVSWNRHDPDWLRNLVCVPVLQDGLPVALLYAGHSRPGFFSQPMIEAAAVLAGYVGAALGNARLYGALAQSESRLRLLTGELRRQASHDSLTGLANRDLARQLLESSLASDQTGRVGLLFCDLDKFKAVNDRLGHEAGDDLLRQVADRLGGCLRGNDLLARLGGDEFLIVLPQVADLEAVTLIGHRVLAALADPFELGMERVRVAASIGGVIGERGSSQAEVQAGDLLRDADAAMYEAKNRGRGRVEVFDRFTAQKAVDRLTLREDLLTALDRGELELNYQPIVNLDDARVIGFEALLRWHHRELGLIPPLIFIPMAEETGAITSIGGWVLAEACRQLARWQRDSVRSLSMAVNVSPIQLLDPAFVEKTVRAIAATGLSNRQVWLEVTESIEVTDQLSDQLRLLRNAGVRVAMDDFGMSYSNLGYLKHLQVERLKIDRSFVAGLAGPAGGDGMDRGIVRAILAIAESAGMSVVAEGIETEDQRRVLLELGCSLGQGYLFAKPMRADQASALLASGSPVPVPRQQPVTLMVDQKGG
jgi:diguanylate cyclase (GGDEF)-like protein